MCVTEKKVSFAHMIFIKGQDEIYLTSETGRIKVADVIIIV